MVGTVYGSLKNKLHQSITLFTFYINFFPPRQDLVRTVVNEVSEAFCRLGLEVLLTDTSKSASLKNGYPIG